MFYLVKDCRHKILVCAHLNKTKLCCLLCCRRCWHNNFSIKAGFHMIATITTIAKKWFPHDRNDRWRFFFSAIAAIVPMVLIIWIPAWRFPTLKYQTVMMSYREFKYDKGLNFACPVTLRRCQAAKLPLQKRAKKSLEFRGKIPSFPRFFAHKEKPGKPGVSWLSRKARRLLAFHAFQEILESVESQETPHFPGFPRFHCLLGSQECYSQKPGKAWKARKKSPRFPGFPLCAKKRGKPGMIPAFQDSAVSWKAWETNPKSMESQE